MSELPVQLSSKDRSDPTSLINVMPSFIAERFEVVPDSVLELTDSELRKQAKIDLELERLRVSFWVEYDRACRTKSQMQVGNILGGLCTREYFFKSILTNSYKVAFMCRAMPDLAILAEETLYLATEQIRDILTLPHINEKGKVDATLAKLKLEVFKETYNRVKGMVVQKVENKNLNVNVNQSAQPKSLDEVNARLAELEKPVAIDVTPTPVEKINGED